MAVPTSCILNGAPPWGILYPVIQLQQDHYCKAISTLPREFLCKDFCEQACQGGIVLSRIPCADRSNSELVGKVTGMILCLGKPNLLARLHIQKVCNIATHMFDRFDKEFDALVHSFSPLVTCDLSMQDMFNIQHFHDTCEAFLATVIGDCSNKGLFGFVNGRLG